MCAHRECALIGEFTVINKKKIHYCTVILTNLSCTCVLQSPPILLESDKNSARGPLTMSSYPSTEGDKTSSEMY